MTIMTVDVRSQREHVRIGIGQETRWDLLAAPCKPAVAVVSIVVVVVVVVAQELLACFTK